MLSTVVNLFCDSSEQECTSHNTLNTPASSVQVRNNQNLTNHSTRQRIRQATSVVSAFGFRSCNTWHRQFTHYCTRTRIVHSHKFAETTERDAESSWAQ